MMKKVFLLILVILLNLSFVFASNNKDDFMYRKTIAIDLDGVLDNYTKYTEEIPPIRKGAKDFIVKLSKDYDLILFTTRSSKQATEWLQNNKIDKYFKDVTNVKPLATMYLDDRAIKFNGNYDKTLNEIEKFKVYWKK